MQIIQSWLVRSCNVIMALFRYTFNVVCRLKSRIIPIFDKAARQSFFARCVELCLIVLQILELMTRSVLLLLMMNDDDDDAMR